MNSSLGGLVKNITDNNFKDFSHKIRNDLLKLIKENWSYLNLLVL